MRLQPIFLTLMLLLSSAAIPAMGQERSSIQSKIFITGAVYDSQTKEPLINAHFILHRSENYSTQSNGKFSLFGHPGDTISYRYTGYKDINIIIPDTLKQMEYLMGVFMPKDTILLPEIVIFPRIENYPSIVSEVKVSDQMINQAQKNVNKAVIQGLTTQTTNYDAEMNAKKTFRGYEMKAQYKGLLVTPENSVGLSTANYQANYLQFGSPIMRKNKITNEMATRSEIDLILATHEVMKPDTTKYIPFKP
jgi:hypothetical protein